jgi:hypothetical protein
VIVKLIFNEILKLKKLSKFGLNSLILDIICCNHEKSVLILLIAVVFANPCSNEGSGRRSQHVSSGGKMVKSTSQELLFQLTRMD